MRTLCYKRINETNYGEYVMEQKFLQDNLLVEPSAKEQQRQEADQKAEQLVQAQEHYREKKEKQRRLEMLYLRTTVNDGFNRQQRRKINRSRRKKVKQHIKNET